MQVAPLIFAESASPNYFLYSGRIQASQTDSGITPTLINQPNIAQPIQNPKIDSSVEAKIINATRITEITAAPLSHVTNAAIERNAPIPCANLFGGPGTYFGFIFRFGTIIFVTN